MNTFKQNIVKNSGISIRVNSREKYATSFTFVPGMNEIIWLQKIFKKMLRTLGGFAGLET